MIESSVLTLIGGTATGIVTGVVGNALYAGLTKTKTLLPIADYRKTALTKTWSGFFLMPEADERIEKVEIIMNLSVKGKIIIGNGNYSDTVLKLKGGFFRDDYFYLNYENVNKSIFQRGMMIFYYPNNPIEIKGKFLGIRRAKDKIASGDIILKAK